MSREGVGVTVDTRQLRAALRTLIKELGARRVLTELGIATRTEIDLNFQKQGNDEGRWRSLAPSTLERRRKPGSGSRRGGSVPMVSRVSGMILQDTGRLRNSMTYNLNGSASVDIGTKTKYGRVHQEGTIRSIPRRPFLPTARFAESNVAKRVIDTLFAEIKAKMEASGGGIV